MNIKHSIREHESRQISEACCRLFRGRTVLVTGAGGSIGGEISRQISRCCPGRMILVGRGEYSIFQIEQELKNDFPLQDTKAVIGDVSNEPKMNAVLSECVPDIVFHSAALKHLLYVEEYPEEGVLANIFGTKNLAKMAQLNGVEKFVFLSSDKAVNPTSVYGATKNICEMVVRELSRTGGTEFVRVRFGNILNSRGSVIPVFNYQIDNGGPVVVRDPGAKRYFMSLSEAVGLVLDAAELGKAGDLLVLDMKQQRSILELAEQLIIERGLRPNIDVEIVHTKLARGEKLVEQLLTEKELDKAEKHGQLLVCRDSVDDITLEEDVLEKLRDAVFNCDRRSIRRLLRRLVPAYK